MFLIIIDSFHKVYFVICWKRLLKIIRDIYKVFLREIFCTGWCQLKLLFWLLTEEEEESTVIFKYGIWCTTSHSVARMSTNEKTLILDDVFYSQIQLCFIRYQTIGRNLYYKDNIALKMYSRISSNLFSILSNMIIITHVKYLITLGTYIDDKISDKKSCIAR